MTKNADPLAVAVGIAARAHAGQIDKAGAPYILHPLRVMLSLSDADERMAAALHDVLEDGPGWTADRLLAEGIPPQVVEAVVALSRRPEEDYAAFIIRCGANPIARAVKLADLADNMDVRRLARPLTAADEERLQKYQRAAAQMAAL